MDNIHFQYNALMQGLLVLATFMVSNGSLYKGAIFYSVLLNFKHIYLYFAPAFGVYLVMTCFESEEDPAKA